MDGVPRLTVMINRKDYYGRNCNPHFWFRLGRGYFVEVRACANGFLQVFSPPGALPAPKREWCFPARRYVRRRGGGGSPPGALSAPKGEWPYTEATPSGATPTSPPEGVFRHKRLMELDELSGRTSGRLGYIRAYTATRIRGLHYEPDYGPSHELQYGPRYRSSYAAMHAGPRPATAPPRRWTGRRTTLDTYIWRSRPRAPGAPEVMTPTCAAGDRTRSAEVYYTAGLNNAGCATRLRRQAKEERRGPDPSWSR